MFKINSKAGVRPAFTKSQAVISTAPSHIKNSPINLAPSIVPKKQPAPKSANELLFYGFHQVRALFKNRKQDIIRAYCTEERVQDMKDILKWCANNKKAYHVVSAEDLAKISSSVHHEGVALLARRRPTLQEDDLYAKLKKERQPLIVLDEVMNPHNIGSILRIMAHFGWKHLVCQEEHAVQMSGSSARMSEGGYEYVEFTPFKDLGVFLRTLKSLGYQTIGTSTHGRKSLYAQKLNTSACAFFLGNEIRGLSKDIAMQLDVTVAIPSIGEVQSLNVAMASALLIGECVRQHGVNS